MLKRCLKLLAASLVVGTLTFAPEIYDVQNFSVVHAEIKMYTAKGEDYASSIESQDVARLRALDKAIKNATKQAGVYLKNYSRSINSELTDEEVITITSNAYELVGEPKYNRIQKQITDETFLIVWQATVNVNVDDAEVRKWRKRDDKERSSLINQTREIQDAAAKNERKVEDLRKRAEIVAGESERVKLKKEFDQADTEFLLNLKLEEGTKFLFQSYYSQALNSFGEAIKINPNYAEAYCLRCETYQGLGKLDAALKDINKAIELDPTGGNGYYSTRAYLYEDLKQYDKALADFNKMIELNPKSTYGYHGRATIYEAFNQKEKAIEEYTRAISVDPSDVQGYSSRADLYEELGQYDKAIADLTKMIELNPQGGWSYLHRGISYNRRAELYAKMNRNEQALADLTECINLETDDVKKAEAYDHRGNFYRFTLELPDKAVADYKKAMALYTKAIASTNEAEKLSRCYFSRAWLYESFELYEKALADYNEVIRLTPQDSVGYEYRGKLYQKLELYDEAIADYLKVIEIEPGELFSYEPLGELYEDLEQYDKAIAVYNKMIAINPNDTRGYRYRGNVYTEIGQYDKALADYNKCIKLDPYDSYGYYWRGKCYEAMGETAKAQADFKKSDELKR